MQPTPPIPPHRELAHLISRNLHLIREHLDDVAGIPGDYSDPNCALFARVHDDLERIQTLLETLRPSRQPPAPN